MIGIDTTVRVYGLPKGQPRARAFAVNGKARMYDPGTAEAWKAQIAQAMQPHMPPIPHDCTIKLDVMFLMPRPKSHFGTGKKATVLKPSAPMFYTSKPDRDNLDKAVLDALTAMGFWRDDSLAAKGAIIKVYCPLGVPPGAILKIRFLEESSYFNYLTWFGVSHGA